MNKEEFLKHRAALEEKKRQRSVDDKAFDLVEGSKKIDLFNNNTVKPFSEMNMEELSNTAKILSKNPGGRPQAPSDLRGKDRTNWYKKNFTHPLTGQTLEGYMQENGLDAKTAFKKFDSITKNLSNDLRDEIRIKTGTKLDLLKLAINDENIGNFLGVTNEMKNNQHIFHASKIDVDLSNQSSFAQGYLENITTNKIRPILNNYIDQLGYQSFNQINQNLVNQGDKRVIPWEIGELWNKE